MCLERDNIAHPNQVDLNNKLNLQLGILTLYYSNKQSNTCLKGLSQDCNGARVKVRTLFEKYSGKAKRMGAKNASRTRCGQNNSHGLPK